MKIGAGKAGGEPGRTQEQDRRGFCPACGARRMAQTAAHLVDQRPAAGSTDERLQGLRPHLVRDRSAPDVMGSLFAHPVGSGQLADAKSPIDAWSQRTSR